MDRFVDALVCVPVRLYRRGNDIVPLVPFDVPRDLCFLDARVPLIVRLSCGNGVNRRWNGPPDRHPKGTPLIDEFWR
jgi:hypothetical protein